jgi:hypothetical protein
VKNIKNKLMNDAIEKESIRTSKRKNSIGGKSNISLVRKYMNVSVRIDQPSMPLRYN